MNIFGDKGSDEVTETDNNVGGNEFHGSADDEQLDDFSLAGTALHLCSYPDCGRTFSKPSRLRDHERVHSGARPYACPVFGCDKSYRRAQHLRRHEISAHIGTAEEVREMQQELDLSVKDVVCKQCGNAFSNSDNLKKHIKNVHERRYDCTFSGCEASFHKKFQLRNHCNFEHKGLSLQCDFEGCGKTFDCLSRLKHHRKAGHVEYKCDEQECNFVCYRWSALRKHKADAHSASKAKSRGRKSRTACPYVDCGRSYVDKRNLDAHIDAIHKKLVYICKLCDAEFAHNKSLKEHAVKMHAPTSDIPVQNEKSVTEKTKKPGSISKVLDFIFSSDHCPFDCPPKKEAEFLSHKLSYDVLSLSIAKNDNGKNSG